MNYSVELEAYIKKLRDGDPLNLPSLAVSDKIKALSIAYADLFKEMKSLDKSLSELLAKVEKRR